MVNVPTIAIVMYSTLIRVHIKLGRAHARDHVCNAVAFIKLNQSFQVIEIQNWL